MSSDKTPPPETHCEYCGAEYTTASPTEPAPRPKLRREVASSPAPPEPLGRCEFCGAEYEAPEPDAD